MNNIQNGNEKLVVVNTKVLPDIILKVLAAAEMLKALLTLAGRLEYREAHTINIRTAFSDTKKKCRAKFYLCILY